MAYNNFISTKLLCPPNIMKNNLFIILIALTTWTVFNGAHLVIPDESGFVNNWKLLLSEKSCEAIEYHPSLSRTAIACEESKLALNCSDQRDTAIVVCEALFGRDNLHECSPARSMDTNCASLDAINVVTEQCQWKSQCSIKASKHEFADPCPGQSKFLRVKYICLNRLYAASLLTTTTTTTTEGPLVVGQTTTAPKYCPPTESRGLVFPRTQSGKNAFVDCPKPNSLLIPTVASVVNKKKRDLPYARYRCGADGKWLGRPDLSRCESDVGLEMKKLTEDLNQGSTQPLDAAKLLEEKATSSKITYGGDIISTVDAIKTTANITAIQESASPLPEQNAINQVAKSLARSGSAILSDEQFPIWGDLPDFKQDVAGSKLIEGIEQSMMAEAEAKRKNVDPGPVNVGFDAWGFGDEDSDASLHVEDNIIAEVSVVNVDKLSGKPSKSFPERLKRQKDQDLKIFLDDSESVLMPTSQMRKYSQNGLAKVVYIQYRNLERFMGYSAELPSFNDSFSTKPTNDDDKNFYVDFPAAGQSRTHILNSKIVTISMGDRRVKMELDEPVVFTLRHERIDGKHKPKCCYWDYNPWTYRGAWSAEGCYRIRSNATHTTCGCNHLTSFAILVDISGQEEKAAQDDRDALSMITTIGCSISSVCLLLFWFTFQFIDRKLDSDQRTVHKHLALCLFCGEVLFVTGIQHASVNETACKGVGIALQFFFTSAFVWMLLEGVQIAIKLKELVPSSTRKWPIYYLAAYGTSILLVGITSGLSGFAAYSNGQTCWLHGVWLLYFVVPVGIVILVNMFILSYLIYKACSLLNHANDHVVYAVGKESKLYQTRSTIKGIAAATILLGLTWSFGFLYVNQHFVIAAYLFSLFNSLQGLLIFLFFCVFNKWVRRQYAVWFRSICCCCGVDKKKQQQQQQQQRRRRLDADEDNNKLADPLLIDSETSRGTSSSTFCSCFSSSASRQVTTTQKAPLIDKTSKNHHHYYPSQSATPTTAPQSSHNNTNSTNQGATITDQSASSQSLLVSPSPQPPLFSLSSSSGVASSAAAATTSTTTSATSQQFSSTSSSSSSTTTASSNLNTNNQNILAKMFKNRMASSSPQATKVGLNQSTLVPVLDQALPAQTVVQVVDEKSPLPDLILGKLSNNHPQQKANDQMPLLGDLEPEPPTATKNNLVFKSTTTTTTATILEATSYNNAVYDSLVFSQTDSLIGTNTDNVTDYMAQAFAMTSSTLITGKELHDFDEKFALKPEGPANMATFDEEDDEDDEHAAERDDKLEPLISEEVAKHHLLCPKSKTFSDFLSVLVQQHEQGLIDDEAVRAQNRMFVSRIFESNHHDYVNVDDDDRPHSPATPNSSSNSSLSISAIPDMYGPLDDLHLSTGSLGNKGMSTTGATPKRHDSGFCSNKAPGNQNPEARSPVSIDKTFPLRRILNRSCSEGDVFKAQSGKNHHGSGSEHHHHQLDSSLDASQMFDDTDGDNLLLVDTTLPSHVRSLTFLPSS